MKTPFLRAEHVGLYRYEFGPDNYYEERDLSEQLALLSIWSYIAAADGPIQASTGASVCSLLVGLSDLQPFEVNRLHAHAAWLAAHPASLGDARRRFGPPDDWEIDKTAFVIASMAHIDVTLTPARIKATTKVYGMLGLTSERLHADLHRISTERTPPTQIIQGEAVAGYGIPAAPSPGEVLLDPNRIAAVRLQTDSISSVLHDVFAENNSVDQRESPAPQEPDIADAPYLQLLAQLGQQPSWSMSEIASLAAPVGLMAAGAIETLNDRAIALGLEPLLDCNGDVCDCYQPTLKELLAHV